MEKYLTFDEFKERVINLPENETWCMWCEGGDVTTTLFFTKYTYESCSGFQFPFVVYSYPMTINAGFIQEDEEDGWDKNLLEVWNDITDSCGLKPLK